MCSIRELSDADSTELAVKENKYSKCIETDQESALTAQNPNHRDSDLSDSDTTESDEIEFTTSESITSDNQLVLKNQELNTLDNDIGGALCNAFGTKMNTLVRVAKLNSFS